MTGAQLYLGDCLDILPSLPDDFVDAIITDLPYGTTAYEEDKIIPFEPMWEQVKRILKFPGAFITTASQPFASRLIMSNPKWFKYEWIWRKSKPNGWQHAKNMPMKAHESILVFSAAPMGHQSILGMRRMKYNPQGVVECGEKVVASVWHGRTMGKRPNQVGRQYMACTGFPNSILEYPNIISSRAIHPVQKPVNLYEFLVRTYTDPGDTVLDFCAGSFTTGVACVKAGRNFIGIENSQQYFKIGERRIAEAKVGVV